VFDLLKELGKADVDDILNLAKKKNLKQANNRVKIRDGLILLSRKGYIKKENGKWIIVSEFPEKEKPTSFGQP
jgi:hypothetical protein